MLLWSTLRYVTLLSVVGSQSLFRHFQVDELAHSLLRVIIINISSSL
jgi:hypothetical protein